MDKNHILVDLSGHVMKQAINCTIKKCDIPFFVITKYITEIVKFP